MTFTTWDGKPRSIYYSGAEKWARVERPGDAGSSRTKFVFGTVEQIDVASKTIKLASGQTVRYGKLLIATGGTPKSLERSPVTDNVTTFRTAADFRRLRGNVTKASPKDVVIVGGGFLGSELTMSLTKHAGSVTQIFPEEVHVPFFGIAPNGFLPMV